MSTRLGHIAGEPTRYIRVLVYVRPKNEICRTPQPYPVGENYNSINNSMRAEELPRHVRSTTEEGRVDARSYVPVKYQNQFELTTNHNMHVTFLYAETLKHGRVANRRYDMRPWIYGSRVGT